MWANRERVYEGELCVGCGTDLEWWLGQSKRNKAYLVPCDDAFCSKKCLYDSEGRYVQVDPLKQRLKECPTCKGEGKVEIKP